MASAVLGRPSARTDGFCHRRRQGQRRRYSIQVRGRHVRLHPRSRAPGRRFRSPRVLRPSVQRARNGRSQLRGVPAGEAVATSISAASSTGCPPWSAFRAPASGTLSSISAVGARTSATRSAMWAEPTSARFGEDWADASRGLTSEGSRSSKGRAAPTDRR